jgi:hypothetical protein
MRKWNFASGTRKWNFASGSRKWNFLSERKWNFAQEKRKWNFLSERKWNFARGLWWASQGRREGEGKRKTKCPTHQATYKIITTDFYINIVSCKKKSC